MSKPTITFEEALDIASNIMPYRITHSCGRQYIDSEFNGNETMECGRCGEILVDKKFNDKKSLYDKYPFLKEHTVNNIIKEEYYEPNESLLIVNGRILAPAPFEQTKSLAKRVYDFLFRKNTV